MGLQAVAVVCEGPFEVADEGETLEVVPHVAFFTPPRHVFVREVEAC